MQRRISYFDVEWRRRDKTGRVRVTFDDRDFQDLNALSAEELSLLCNLLRVGKTVYYDSETQTFSTLADVVADG